MGGDKAMIAIGVGCRKDCPADTVIDVILEALTLAGTTETVGAIYTHQAKSAEPGVAEAAEALGFPLVFLSAEALKIADAHVETRSERVKNLFDIGSVAEAAALCGAGPGSRLLLRRINHDGATCAIAAEAAP